MLKITENFTDLRLNTDNEGKAQFFNKIMEELQNRDFAILKIGVKMPQGAGGFFTDILAIDQINLPDTVKIVDNILTFTEEDAFEIFMHEACHFEHLSVDDGLCKAPNLINIQYSTDDIYNDRNGLIRRNIEYEAGWRSVYYSKIYKMNNERKVINLNLANMINYDILYQDKETRKRFDKIAKNAKNGAKTAEIFANIFAKVKKFSEWANVDHKIKV